MGGVVGDHEPGIGQPSQVAGRIVDSRAPVSKQPVAFDFHAHHSVGAEKSLQGCRIPETRAPDVAELAAGRPAHARFAPAAVQNVEILVVIDAGRSVHPQLELHLVTVTQRGYPLRLLAVYDAKFAGGRFLKGAARPAYALRNGIPETVSQGT